LFVDPEIAFQRVTMRQKDFEDKVPEERILKNISLYKIKDDFYNINTSSL
jgi:hypothetical protein